jgi:hypothetical protein
MKDRNDPGTEELCLGVPKAPANADPERSALVTVADTRSLRERSEDRDPVLDPRTRSDERGRLGFAGVPTLAFYPGLDPLSPEPAAAPRSGALMTAADANSLRVRSEDRVALSRVRRDDRHQLGFAGVPTMAFYS